MKQVHRLTESQFMEIIENAVRTALNEIDGKTLSRVPNAAINAVNNIQSGVYSKKISSKLRGRTIDYDKHIERANNLYPKAIQSFLAPYIETPYMFFAYKREGNPVHLVFNVENIKKIIDSIVILSGNVAFDNETLPGDIFVEFYKDKEGNILNKVYYKYKGNQYKYILKPDNRTIGKWNELVQGLEDSLTSRLDRGM